jgi:UDP-N-acetylglucosamine--N-acetylmuramyl-(pentapeptide) pyrophosphoryl-undecaprenol N-acetylglucosamine transferase
VNILLSCGRTGGHIKNALNLARYLESARDEIKCYFILPEDEEFIPLEDKKKIKYYSIPAGRTPAGLSPAYFIFGLKMIQSLYRSAIIINEIKPELVIAFGSYASLPVALASVVRSKRIPIIVHEQNIKPGRTTLFLSKLAEKVAVSFKETEEYFRPARNDVSGRDIFNPVRNQRSLNGANGVNPKVSFTGNPVREDLKDISKFEACRYLGLAPDKFNILVIGGSQGSKFINNIMRETLDSLPASIKKDLQVLHISGKNNFQAVVNGYKNIGFDQVKIYDFLPDIEYALASSDLIISRAGAMVLSEAAVYGKPLIVIPYPYARSHQGANAEFLKKHKAAVVVNQQDFDINDFKRICHELITNKDKLRQLSESIKNLADLGANERFTSLIFEVLEREK